MSDNIDIPSAPLNVTEDVTSVDVNQSGSFVTIAHGDEVEVRAIFSEDQTTLFKSQQMAIHQVVTSPNSQSVIICSNHEIPSIFQFDNLTNVKQYTKVQNPPKDEDGFVFCAVDPQNKYYAFVSFSRTIYIWNNGKVLHKIKNAIDKDVTRSWLGHSSEKLPIKISWTSDGKYLIVASGPKIHFYHRDSWREEFSLPCNGTSYHVSISDNDRYLAVACFLKGKNELNIYFQNDIGVYELTEHLEFDTPIINIQFHKSSEMLCLSTLGGELYVVNEFLKGVSSTKRSAKLDITVPTIKATASQLLDEDSMNDETGEDEELIEEPRNDPFATKNVNDDPLIVDMEDEEIGKPTRKLNKKAVVYTSSGDDDEILFSDKVSQHGSPKSIPLEGSPIAKDIMTNRQSTISKCRFQLPFQSGATELHEGKRFLCYNSVGIIKVSSISGKSSQYYEIEHHDALVGSVGSIEKSDRYQLADLAPSAYILGSKGGGNVHIPSSILYKSLKSDITWEYTLPGDERADVVCLANNGETVAIATTEVMDDAGDYNSYCLRILTGSGAHIVTIDLEGPVITMVGSKHLLGIAYCNQIGIRRYMIIQPRGGRILYQGNLTLTTNSKLTWMGFDENELLYTADSAGIVRVLSIDHWNQWMRISTLSNTPSEFAHVVYIASRTIFYIRASNSEIPVLPPPMVQRSPFSLKLFSNETNGDNKKNIKYEEDFIIQNLIINAQKRDIIENNSIEKSRFLLQESKPLSDAMIEMDKTLLRLSEYCLLSDSNSLKKRIFDFAPYFNKKQSIEFARQIAHKQREKKIENQLLGMQKLYFSQSNEQEFTKRLLPGCTRDYGLLFTENIINSLRNVNNESSNHQIPNSYSETNITLDQELESTEIMPSKDLSSTHSERVAQVQHTPGRPSLFSPKKQKRPEAKRPIFAKRATNGISNEKKSTPFTTFEPQTETMTQSALESMDRGSKAVSNAKEIFSNLLQDAPTEASAAQPTTANVTHQQSTLSNILKRKRESEKENLIESNKRARSESQEVSPQKTPSSPSHKVEEVQNTIQETDQKEIVDNESIEIVLSERKKLQLPRTFDKSKFTGQMQQMESDSDEELIL